MATGILMPGAVVANPLDIIPPAIANLSVWTYLGASLAASVNAGSAGAFVAGMGTGIVWSPHYAGCHGAQGSIGIPAFVPSQNETWMAVARYTGGGTTGANGILLGPVQGQAGLYVQLTATTLNIQASGITSPTALTIAASGGSVFKFYAVTSQPGGPHTLYNLTDATSQVAAAAGSLTLPPSIAFGIGGNPSAGTNDRGTDIAFAAWAQTTLTKPQIDAQYAAVKVTLAQYGIPV